MKRDYYEVLGVDRSASGDEIRQAYRRLARVHHPDVSGDDPSSDARFKEINEAYEVLRDPDRRAAYDRFGHAGAQAYGRSGPAGDPFSDIGDIFEQFFGFGARSRPRARSTVERGQDIRTRLRLELAEAAFGAPRTVEVQRLERCEACRGTGARAGSGPTQCRACQGSGEVRRTQQSIFGTFVTSQPCPECGGQGEVIGSPCADCQGQGRTRRKRRLEVDVPAGVEDGTQIRLTGEGDVGPRGGPPGDLFVVLQVRSHPVFERQGNDLHVRLQVNPADAALGTEVEVPTLDGTATVVVPPGTQSGETVVLEGKGVPRLRGVGRGDLVASIEVVTPAKLSREERKLYEQLRKSLPRAQVAERGRGVWDRVREHLG